MRLPPPSTPWYLRPLHGWQRRRYGTVLQPTWLWSYRPRALLTFGALFGTLRRRKSPLPLALRALVSLRVSQPNCCDFCVDLNVSVLAAASIDEDRALAVADWRIAGRFSDSERLALQYAEAMNSSATCFSHATLTQRIAQPRASCQPLLALTTRQRANAPLQNAPLQTPVRANFLFHRL